MNIPLLKFSLYWILILLNLPEKELASILTILNPPPNKLLIS
jgi:hypothetical protein